MKDKRGVWVDYESNEGNGRMPLELFRHYAHIGIDLTPRIVVCNHCGMPHRFPSESFKRIWYNPLDDYYEVHYECPHADCEGWLADFQPPRRRA